MTLSTEPGAVPDTAAGAAPTPTDRRGRSRSLLQDYGVYAALVVILLFNLVFTDNFWAWSNFRIQLIQVAPVVIVSLGMALVIGTGGVDLSVGAVMALAAAALPLYLGYGAVPAIVVALLFGLVVGLVNGTLVAVVGLQPIVATLALFVGGRGLAVVLEPQLTSIENTTVIGLGTNSIGPLPIIVLIAVIFAVLVWALVRFTTFGRRLLAIGGNRAASELAGLPVRRILLIVYVLCAVLAAVAGVLATGRLQASNPSQLGLLMELQAITAVVVGGTPLTGGRVRIVGTVAGALLMQLLIATLIKHDVPNSVAQLAQAAIILVAVYAARQRSTR